MWTISMPIGDMQTYSPADSPGASKDFYVDNLLRGPGSLARPVPLPPAVFLKSVDEPPVKRSNDHLKFGVNAILALDPREKIVSSREVYNPSKYSYSYLITDLTGAGLHHISKVVYTYNSYAYRLRKRGRFLSRSINIC